MTIPGKILAQINRAEQLLNDLGKLDARNKWVSYPADLPGRVRVLSYLDEFNLYTSEKLFDFILVDHALFQFKFERTDDISYCYYQAPFDAPTYQEFLIEQLGDDLAAIEEIGDGFHDEYEQVVDTARLRKGVAPIRYDYNPNLYEAGVHPAAHIHIGSGNDIRIFTKRLMSPLSFVLFVLRQMYPDSWRQFLQRKDASFICRAIREDIEMVKDIYEADIDRFQLVLE